MTSPAFRAYVEQLPGAIARIGRRRGARQLGGATGVDGIRQALAAAGASILYLPPYSPDLNPIEQLLAKLKALLRKAAARTRDELRSTIARLLDSGPPLACANYLKHCGYGST